MWHKVRTLRDLVPAKGKAAVIIKGAATDNWDWWVHLYQDGIEQKYYGVKSEDDGFKSIVQYFPNEGIKSRNENFLGGVVTIYQSNRE